MHAFLTAKLKIRSDNKKINPRESTLEAFFSLVFFRSIQLFDNGDRHVILMNYHG